MSYLEGISPIMDLISKTTAPEKMTKVQAVEFLSTLEGDIDMMIEALNDEIEAEAAGDPDAGDDPNV